MPLRLGPMELVIILVIIMMVFGVGRLPQVGNSIGKAMREFRKAQDGDDPEESSGVTAGSADPEGDRERAR